MIRVFKHGEITQWAAESCVVHDRDITLARGCASSRCSARLEDTLPLTYSIDLAEPRYKSGKPQTSMIKNLLWAIKPMRLRTNGFHTHNNGLYAHVGKMAFFRNEGI